MAQTGSYDLGFRLDIKQMLSEAQHRWLRPSEISEILRNYPKFQISPEAPNKPVSGSVFLFDRKVLRYFRKDGHNWRKKKDGKTVREAHEKLKVGSVDMLHCYYAHGEDNENFQRRSYWLLEQDLSNIVFVHYLEVKGNKTSISYVRNSDTMISNSENGSPLTSSFLGTSPTSTLSSGYEDIECEDNHHASSRLNAYSEFPITVDSHSPLSSSHNRTSSGNQNISALSYNSPSPDQRYGIIGGGNILHGALTAVDSESWQGNCTTGEVSYKQEPVNNWQHSFGDSSSQLRNPNINQNVVLNSPQDNGSNLFEGKFFPSNQENGTIYASPDELKELSELSSFQMLLSDGMAVNSNLENGIENESYSFLKKPLISGLQTGDSLKKVDSFSSWMAKELLETDDLNMHSSCGIPWSEFESNMTAQLQADIDTLSPSVPQDQLFSIIDFSPNWAYSNLETKVLIVGSFLKSEEELSKCRWSIMFGEVEVPAEILANGILCCRAPLHKPGVVPFYMTCSNRLCCSELREFEYRLGPDHIISSVDGSGGYVIVMHLYQRFEMMLGLGPVASHPVSSSESDFEKQNVMNKIHLMMEEDNDEAVSMSLVNDKSQPKLVGQLLIEKQMKQKFYSWLIHRVYEGGKGITVLDERGQNVLHLAAALGFNWVFQPIIVSGVSIDFRDMNGWTALHWAAFYGREETVAVLVALGAAPGALTDPSAEHPCKTPADLASSSGHKGISGYLAEAILTTHLSKLDVEDQHDGATDVPGINGVQTVSERSSVPVTGHDVPDTLSLKDSLAAVCNATQAAARIHQIFRIKSFQRKQLIEEESDELPTSDERAISLIAGKKASKFSHVDGMASSAALQIQKKFRGWTKRKEFLLIRQKIVKIQAHVRGHQVRKKYKSITWSVGILEKVILRWRRKGSGLRGFRSDGVVKEGANAEGSSQSDDDYDFLKEGRKQSEERMQKALSRVKSMAQYPEARAQYRRLLTTAEGLRETKEASDMTPSNSEEMIYPEDDLIDLEALFDDDALMSLAFQ